jgi:flavin-dependent dehydrogenase
MVPVEEFVTEGHCDRYTVTLGERYHGLYEWRFPAGGNVSIGSGKGIMSVEEYISKGARNIPFGGVDRISDNGAYLCGDAAGMANPVSFGGLRAALNSGQEAAREIVVGRSYQRWWDGNILSNRRFMWFRDRLMGMTDDELERMARPVSKGNLYVRGILSGIRHPSYVPMYIGCLKTFSRTW